MIENDKATQYMNHIHSITHFFNPSDELVDVQVHNKVKMKGSGARGLQRKAVQGSNQPKKLHYRSSPNKELVTIVTYLDTIFTTALCHRCPRIVSYVNVFLFQCLKNFI